MPRSTNCRWIPICALPLCDTQPVSLGKANVVVTKTTVPFLVQLLAGCAQSGTCTKDANGSYSSEITVQTNQGRYVINGNGKTIAAW